MDQSTPSADYPEAATIADFEANLAAVHANIAAAAARAGRRAEEVRLLPISKTVPAERVRLAVAAGCRHLGENKVQEAKAKAAALADLDLSWSVVGHLQTNKAKDVVAFADEFQALDSVRVAQALDRRLQAADRTLDVLVQVNTSAEPQKYGLDPDEVPEFVRGLAEYPTLRVQGLMTLAVFSADTDLVRRCFRRLRDVRERVRDMDADLLGAGELSMGMSGDYEVAIEEGSTCVRVGQAIFGARATPDSHYWPSAVGPASS
ncbi:YggS family pyridoxal phosphate-dependent enzyme [Gordonia phosphorivorans]|uniref:Pyridoxal phosphate homeostasis protein n=1 Tax=Gordonia phosphorivorans TaxID=1056982 RepID=A0ABV6H9N4_9ACTN